ncbi:facilitated trehalose transporter Tret1-like [Maniola hyperantus]|uniref:facilitated trehalose transporter Tret1-like n=1 Tax=Aphantopus hyperantus TaxID=2795564 RepID=UPI003747CFD8
MVLSALSCGFTYGHLTGLIRALHKQEDGIQVNEGQISLLAVCMTFCSVIGMILLGIFGERLGRRWSISLFSIPMLTNWVIMYYTNGFITLLISRILAGISLGGLATLNLVTAAEFTTPKSRALVQSLVSMVAPALGTSSGHILGVIIHWKHLCIVGVVISILHLCLPYFWIESPQWLASKGRFDDCEKAFRKLHGINPKSEDELSLLIKIEGNKQKRAKELNKNTEIKKVFSAFQKKYFWKIMLTNCMIYLYYSAAGKVIFSNLATVMLEEMTGTADILFFTLLVDGFIVVGTCASIILIRKMSIRVLLFSSGFVSNGILIALSACLYFKNSEMYFQWINVALLAIYFIIVHAGPYPVMEVLLGELFPLDIKLFCFLLSTPALVATVCTGIVLMPVLVGFIGYHGLFLLNSAIAFICLAYFWISLPETKGKTLQEIELYFKSNNKFDEGRITSNEQIKDFI